MDEATALRHRVPLRSTDWAWAPRASRAVLPEVAKQNAFDIPKSLVDSEAKGDAPSTAIRDLTALAQEIVPTHDQAEAMYGWFETLTSLESGDKLERARLPEGILKTLRAVPWAYRANQEELGELERAYFDRYGDHGGWTQLKMIVDWTFFLHMWQLLDEQAAVLREVARVLSALPPGRSLLTLGELRATQT